MEIFDLGVLLTGAAGVGKGELALELISRGHHLIADDAPEFRWVAPDKLRGTCPALLQNFLEVRPLGILNVPAMFGANTVVSQAYLGLIIDLEPVPDYTLGEARKSTGTAIGEVSAQSACVAPVLLESPSPPNVWLGMLTQRVRSVLNVEVPELVMQTTPGRNLGIFVECIVRNRLLQLNGYNAAHDFISHQRQAIERN